MLKLLPNLSSACDRFVIVPDSELIPWPAFPSFRSVRLTDRQCESTIFISPCRKEHWISTDIYKVRLYCEKHDIRIVTFGSLNHFPFYSLFSDEVVVSSPHDAPSWYEDPLTCRGRYSSNNIDLPPVQFVDVDGHHERSELREKSVEEISDFEVIDRFSHKTIHLLKSAYEVFLSLDLEPHQRVVEAKRLEHEVPFLEAAKKQTTFDFKGASDDMSFQKGLLEKTTRNHYMTMQILASNLLDWQFFCCGGASNLMCVLPIKTLFFVDDTMNFSVQAVTRGFYLSQHGKAARKCPIVLGIHHAKELAARTFIENLYPLKEFSDYLSTLPPAVIQPFTKVGASVQ